MKVVSTGLWFSLLLLSCLFLSISVVKADLMGFDGIVEAQKPYIISPLNNETCLNPLTLDIHFYANVWGNVKFTMVYSLDGQLNEPVPLTDHYVSWVSGHHNESYVDGLAALPVLSEGSHTITVYLECVHEIGYHDRIETFHYFDNETVYFIVRNTAQPTPTDNYASTTQSETAMPEPESYPTLLITEVAFSVAIAFVFVVPTVIYFKKHKPKVEPS